ncbi:hypothetical protein [Salinicola aestuarinus]|uniref:hypothetical protein n=1 Tax=Salinicola aestuarinus TaxID=1949082 RepID=UPI000DA165AE|nr:hypothetical protein [Salinicola aestuarinus]
MLFKFTWWEALLLMVIYAWPLSLLVLSIPVAVGVAHWRRWWGLCIALTALALMVAVAWIPAKEAWRSYQSHQRHKHQGLAIAEGMRADKAQAYADCLLRCDDYYIGQWVEKGSDSRVAALRQRAAQGFLRKEGIDDMPAEAVRTVTMIAHVTLAEEGQPTQQLAHLHKAMSLAESSSLWAWLETQEILPGNRYAFKSRVDNIPYDILVAEYSLRKRTDANAEFACDPARFKAFYARINSILRSDPCRTLRRHWQYEQRGLL